MASGHNLLVYVRHVSGAWAQQVHAEASGHLALLMKSCGESTKAQRLLHAPSDGWCGSDLSATAPLCPVFQRWILNWYTQSTHWTQ